MMMNFMNKLIDVVSQIAIHELDEEDSFYEQMKEAFRMYDKDENGYINVGDLREILRALDESSTEDELDELIAEIDTDGSGTIDFDDFMDVMTQRENEDDEENGNNENEDDDSEDEDLKEEERD